MFDEKSLYFTEITNFDKKILKHKFIYINVKTRRKIVFNTRTLSKFLYKKMYEEFCIEFLDIKVTKMCELLTYK